jgi:tRNA uridine 5-carbamoylmethylation protein Kti12
MKNAMTKRDCFNLLAELVTISKSEKQAELLEFISHELELLDKKSSSNRLNVAKINEQSKIQKNILEVLKQAENGLTATEIQRTNDELNIYSLPKISAMLKKLIQDGSVIRTVEKKKAIFRMA